MEQMLSGVVDQIFQLAISGVAILALFLIKRAAGLVKIRLNAEQEAWIKSMARGAARWAEEKTEARKKTKKVVSKSADKLALAVTRLLDKVPNISRAEAAAIIEQELPKLGLGATAFVFEVVKAAASPDEKDE